MDEHNNPAAALEPCPFCGGNAKDDTDAYGNSYIICNDCGSQTSGDHLPGDAIQQWNSRAPKASAVPEGWKLVPVEPTREMWQAANKVDDQAYAGGSQHGASIEDCWNAMVDAAPSAPQAEEAPAEEKPLQKAERTGEPQLFSYAPDRSSVRVVWPGGDVRLYDFPEEAPVRPTQQATSIPNENNELGNENESQQAALVPPCKPSESVDSRSAYQQMTPKEKAKHDALVAKLDGMITEKIDSERRKNFVTIDFSDRRIADRRRTQRD